MHTRAAIERCAVLQPPIPATSRGHFCMLPGIFGYLELRELVDRGIKAEPHGSQMI